MPRHPKQAEFDRDISDLIHNYYFDKINKKEIVGREYKDQLRRFKEVLPELIGPAYTPKARKKKQERNLMVRIATRVKNQVLTTAALNLAAFMKKAEELQVEQPKPKFQRRTKATQTT